jgi:hypothetical protein
MASIVAICNAALIRIGAATITSLTDDSREARACNVRFADVRDEVLRAHPWNFALKRVALAELAETPAFGFAKAFQLPTDCLRVLELDTSDLGAEFRIENGKLLTDESAVKILYIARIEDPNLYDPLFSNALSYRLAAELAYPIANSTALTDTMFQLYQRALAQAKTADAQESSLDRIEATEWETARL